MGLGMDDHMRPRWFTSGTAGLGVLKVADLTKAGNTCNANGVAGIGQ